MIAGIYTFGICLFQKLILTSLLSKSFLPQNKPDKAKKIGTAQFSICLTSHPILTAESIGYAVKVWIPTTIIIAMPRKNS